MQDFPANSNKAKVPDGPREKIAPVTSAEPVRRKRGLGRQFRETFFAGDSRTASQYMVEDIIVPAIRDTLFDAVQGWVSHLFFGDNRNRRTNLPGGGMVSGYSGLGQVNYASKSKSSQPQRISQAARARHDFSDLVVPNANDANEVIDRMFDILSSHGMVSVADLYALTDIVPEHTDLKWGWTNLRGAKPRRLRTGGYVLDLPKPEAFA